MGLQIMTKWNDSLGEGTCCKGCTTPIDIEAGQPRIPLGCMLEGLQSGHIVALAAGDRAEIVIAVGDGGTKLLLELIDLVCGFGIDGVIFDRHGHCGSQCGGGLRGSFGLQIVG